MDAAAPGRTMQTLIQNMTLAKAGDKAAFESLYAECFAPVYRYIYKRTHDAAIAEDLAQTVFIKMYTSNTSFANQSVSPLAYLFTAAKNVLADYWKKNHNHHTVYLDESVDMEVEIKSCAASVTASAQCYQYLALLPSEQRMVLELKFLQGYSTQEIAQRLQKTPEAVRQIQCRALKLLRDRVSKQNPL